MNPTRPRQPFKYFSLFSGIGGFELGIQTAFTKRHSTVHQGDKYKVQSESCIGFSEIDKYATQVYKNHFNHKEYGDVSAIDWSDTEYFNLLVGGFPCQAFSIAGKRQGFCDTRGTLFFEIARCLREKQPCLFLLENVKGLLSHDKGKTFGVILDTLDELGYDLQWQVLNSKNFGVPQNRERVFIVGHLRGTRRPEVFPIGESSSRFEKLQIQKRPSKRGLGNPTNVTQSSRGDNKRSWNNHITGTLDANYSKGDNRPSNKSNCPRVFDYGSIRRLTPIECERLQGFPDKWTEGISNTQRYKCLGNAVTVNVIETIMVKLLETL